MKTLVRLLISCTLCIVCSCKDYLDVVPDNIATIENAFTNAENTERYLFGCYSFLPNPASQVSSPSILTNAENYVSDEGNNLTSFSGNDRNTLELLKGNQNANSPYLNYWDGGNQGTNLYIAIRDCNIFLENIDMPKDIEPRDKRRWIAEAKFLKAYYHFYLMRMYGPIPIIRENIDVASSPDLVKVYRDPVEDVVEYIAELIDEAVDDLPLFINNPAQEMGRITQPIALAIKAQAMTLAASPLFNGNYYYSNITDNRNQKLFSGTEDISKWEKAADAIKDAIESAHEAGHTLFYYNTFNPISDTTKVKMNIRGAVTERWNEEIIWGSTKNSNDLQKISMVRNSTEQHHSNISSNLSPILSSIERFYSKNGVPIEEDVEYDYNNRYELRTVPYEDRYYMKQGFETVGLHFDREPRFYASVTFDGCLFYGYGNMLDNPSSVLYVEMKRGRPGGKIAAEKFSITGYIAQKLVNFETTSTNTTFTAYRYAFPYLRLADLYLLYAEALNESKTYPDEEVYKWIDLVRERAGLNSVLESWTNYSRMPEKPLSKEGMRSIIRHERMNELAYEGIVYWDLLRWKEAETVMSLPVRGWNIEGSDTNSFYQLKTLATPVFSIKNYLYPISNSSLERNRNLVQNFGW